MIRQLKSAPIPPLLETDPFRIGSVDFRWVEPLGVRRSGHVHLAPAARRRSGPFLAPGKFPFAAKRKRRRFEWFGSLRGSFVLNLGGAVSRMLNVHGSAAFRDLNEERLPQDAILTSRLEHGVLATPFREGDRNAR